MVYWLIHSFSYVPPPQFHPIHLSDKGEKKIYITSLARKHLNEIRKKKMTTVHTARTGVWAREGETANVK